MSATAIVAIVVVIILVAALALGLTAIQRRRRLRNRFGPEYDRLVDERESRRQAEAELTQRERRVRDLNIRPLTESARARYARHWAGLQEQFVDAPADTVAASQLLLTAVITERGYPVRDRDQVLADLSVDHARTLERYRAAEQISETAAAGRATTEDLRQAMIHYRALFRELLGEPAGPQEERTAVPDGAAGTSGYAGPSDRAASSMQAGELTDGTQAADPARAPVTTADPALADRELVDEGSAQIPSQRTPRS